MNINEKDRTQGLRERLIRKLRFGLESRHGFTLIELMVVIVIVAILCTIAIPTFLGQREHAHDAAAYSLVRNALTAAQGAFVDTNDYTQVTADVLNAIEPSITFIAATGSIVATTPAAISNGITANARNHEVEFYSEDANTIDIASRSDSGNLFGLQVNALDLSSSGYVKVKVVDGSAGLGW